MPFQRLLKKLKTPNRNIPIGLIGSLAVCTLFYLLVGYAAVGSVGSQPIMGADGMPMAPGSAELAAACAGSEALVCSKEPLAHVLRLLGFAQIGNLLGLVAALALPSVILMMLYGQTRIFLCDVTRWPVAREALGKCIPHSTHHSSSR